MTYYIDKANQFVTRLGAGASDNLRQDVRAGFGVAERFAGKVAEIKSDKRFSADGHRQEIAKALRSGPLGHLSQLRGSVARQLDAARAERAGFVPKPPDRADVFGELQRQEARTFLRSLPDAERLRLAVETKDATIREAIAHAPAALSGLSEEIKGRVVAAMVGELYGDRLAANERATTTLEEAEMALQMAERDLRRESGLTDAEFNAAQGT